MKEEIKKYSKFRKHSKAKRTNIKARKGFFLITNPENRKPDLDKLIESNYDWFSEMLPKVRQYREEIPHRIFEEGEEISVLGQSKKIVIEKRKSSKVEEDIHLARHLVDRTSIKDRLEEALRSHSKTIFEEKVENYISEIDGEYDKIYIRDQDTRWGSCSGKNNLNFNWRLILGPKHIVDYLVTHELAHLEHRNHSASFWNRVEELMTDYRKSREWLEDNSAKLVFDTSKY